MRLKLIILTVMLIILIAAALGCVRRTLTITSEPSGALIWVNDREVGRTPVDLEFLYYGNYDVRLVREDYEPLQTSCQANPPWWDNVPLDLIAEAVPGEPHAQVHCHYQLQPLRSDPEELIDRATGLRQQSSAPPQPEVNNNSG